MADSTPDLFAPIRSMLAAEVDRGVAPSFAVAVAAGGRIVWEEGFGWADREARRPASAETPYSVASISKPITATAIMLLVERGLVDLDRPINDYLGDAGVWAGEGHPDDATVRRVANHTAGLPLHCQFFYADEPARRPAMDETIRRYAFLVSAPGTEYRYSNMGYGLLDHLIARVSGRSYAEFLRDELFAPLGMVRSAVDLPPDLAPYAAARYGLDGVPYPFYDFDHPGGSAVYSSAHDLALFGLFHLKSPGRAALLSDAALDEMRRPTSGPDADQGYGIGWQSFPDLQGIRRVEHIGSMAGVSTKLVLLPEHGVAIATLANASCDLPARITDEIVRHMVRAGASAPAEAASAETGYKAPDPALIGRWCGIIRSMAGTMRMRLEILESGETAGAIDGGPRWVVKDAEVRAGRVAGVMPGEIRTEDTLRRRHRVALDLRLRDDRLTGATVAVRLPGKDYAGNARRRYGNSLSHWTELTREPSGV